MKGGLPAAVLRPWCEERKYALTPLSSKYYRCTANGDRGAAERTDRVLRGGRSKSWRLQGSGTPALTALMPQLYDRLATRFPAEWGIGSRRAGHANRYRENFEQAFT